MIVTIDGPAGSGKSTVARAVVGFLVGAPPAWDPYPSPVPTGRSGSVDQPDQEPT